MARPTTELSPPWIGITRKVDIYNGGTTTQSSTLSSTLGLYRFSRNWFGSKTPGYKSYKRPLTLPINNHGVTLRWDQDSAWSWRDQGAGWYNQFSSNSASISENISLPYASHLEEARSKAAGKLSRQIGDMKVNLAQAFGERKQTASLLVDTAVRINAASRALRRGNFVDFYHALGMRDSTSARRKWERVRKTHPDSRVANHWLEYVYGWRPLLQDVYGAAELLATHIKNDSVHERVRASGRASTAVQWENKDSTARRDTRTDIIDSKCRYSIDYRLDNEARVVLAQTGISNPALLAWELLPYSFVVDWFIPVGNYLESLDAYSGFVLVRGCLSQLTTRDYLVDFSTYRHFTWTLQNKTGWMRRRSVQFNRSNITSFPTQAFPSFRNPIGNDPLTRFATAAALMKVTFGKR